MEGHVAFHFLHDLVDVSIQNGDGAKAFQIAERLGAILGAPTPVGIDAPERYMCKDNDGGAPGKMLYIILQPLKLLGAEGTETASLEIHDVDQGDEVHAFFIKAVPAPAFAPLAITLEKLLAVIAQDVVLTGHKERIFGRGRLQQLVYGIEFLGFGEVADITGVKEKFRERRQRIDFIDCRLQRSHHVRIGGLVEAHVAVADLHEAQLPLRTDGNF